jgi:hypothetical protein
MWRRSLLLLLVAVPALAGSPKPTRIRWSFDNIVEGYDHVHKMEITADGAPLVTSEPMNESVPGSLVVMIPPGTQNLNIVSYAMWEGTWDAHTIANDYSVDCVWELDVSRRLPKKIDLLCDIDEGASHRMK